MELHGGTNSRPGQATHGHLLNTIQAAGRKTPEKLLRPADYTFINISKDAKGYIVSGLTSLPIRGALQNSEFLVIYGSQKPRAFAVWRNIWVRTYHYAFGGDAVSNYSARRLPTISEVGKSFQW